MMFDILGISDGSEQEDKSGVMVDQFLQMHGERIESIKNLLGRIPGNGEIFFLWTVNSFNAFTFIPYVIKECGIIEELILLLHIHKFHYL